MQPKSHAIMVVLCLFWGMLSARADEVDTYIQAQMRELHLPGLSLAVVREGRIVKLESYGSANLELRAPVSRDTVFEIGSISKQIHRCCGHDVG